MREKIYSSFFFTIVGLLVTPAIGRYSVYLLIFGISAVSIKYLMLVCFRLIILSVIHQYNQNAADADPFEIYERFD
jgi:hypothetical protein